MISGWCLTKPKWDKQLHSDISQHDYRYKTLAFARSQPNMDSDPPLVVDNGTGVSTQAPISSRTTINSTDTTSPAVCQGWLCRIQLSRTRCVVLVVHVVGYHPD